MISSLLIANRGEIACRVIRTARAMGIRTVAVYSDVDALALHVRQADEAVYIGPSPASESYLVGERIIAAAKATGAEAIHPGYGFLSENPQFAQAVIDAGLIWVGPSPSAISAMGLKDAAKTLMDQAGVPVTPGYIGEDQSVSVLAGEAAKVGYPLLIKAVAGGGGKGMRLVENADDFPDALASCKREAASSFGNDHVLIEKFIPCPRHIEVQVFGDTHGNVVHLFERDCSLQRRHQKVIEEAPAPGMDDATREALCAAAVRAAKAIGYVGAGTIEFIADASNGLTADRIWFMEMNTRLQVEHPVTEEITGVDLVEWQIRVASGETLPLSQDQLAINGHAVEARLYAEDPGEDFLPSVGALEIFEIGGNCRADTGVEQGSKISPYYDPMIAKLIVHAPDREAALDRLADALEHTTVWPLQTNVSFLARLLRDEGVRKSALDTGLIASRGEALLADPKPSEHDLTLAAKWIYRRQAGDSPAARSLFGFRLNRERVDRLALNVDGERTVFSIASDGPDDTQLRPMAVSQEVMLVKRGAPWLIAMTRTDATRGGVASNGSIVAPMPGIVTGVYVSIGDLVSAGQKLVTLEAMKMEYTLTAPFEGLVTELTAITGVQVDVGGLLVQLDESETA